MSTRSTQEIFRLPDLGEGLTESEVVEWQVAVGDTVALNQVIAEVETAKAMVEIPSPFAGTVATLHAEEGDVVQVGEPLVTFTLPELSERGAGIPARESDNSGSPDDVSERGAGIQVRESDNSEGEWSGANLVGYGARAARTGRPTRRPRKPVAPPAPPSGIRAPAAPPAEHREPVRSVRKQTAAAMVASAAIPQATVHLTCDVTDTRALLARLREHPRTRDVKIGLLAVIGRAVCALMPDHPALVTRWEENGDGAELVRTAHVHLGIAVATDRGLVVPHVPHADELSLVGLVRALADLAATARAGRTRPERLRGATLTLTNVGVFGVDAGTPLLNPGESAILGIGQVARRPWEHDGAIALRDVVTLSLTFDHRVVDGEQGARFLADLGGLLTDPALALLLGGHDGSVGVDVGTASREAVTA